jgi:hypothetical protein
VPVSCTVCGLFGALFGMDIAALREPAPVGLNVTVILQVLPAEIVALLQVLVDGKSPVFAPVRVSWFKTRLLEPEFVSVRVWEGLDVATSWLAN